MKSRPILFSAPMVRALLAGSKTQTRRVVKPQPLSGADSVIRPFADQRLHYAADDPHDIEQGRLVLGEVPPCPYGQPGERLWVREAWRSGKLTDQFPPRDMIPHRVWYEADGAAPEACNGKSRRAFHMPRWACRITLEITDVRVERLKSISREDAAAEGIDTDGEVFEEGGRYESAGGIPAEVWTYARLWESINGAGSWEANPWVWCVSFKQITPT
jgi:hypothetical protein